MSWICMSKTILSNDGLSCPLLALCQGPADFSLGCPAAAYMKWRQVSQQIPSRIRSWAVSWQRSTTAVKDHGWKLAASLPLIKQESLLSYIIITVLNMIRESSCLLIAAIEIRPMYSKWKLVIEQHSWYFFNKLTWKYNQELRPLGQSALAKLLHGSINLKQQNEIYLSFAFEFKRVSTSAWSIRLNGLPACPIYDLLSQASSLNSWLSSHTITDSKQLSIFQAKSSISKYWLTFKACTCRCSQMS